jgi:hypothetical protein
VPQRQLEHDAPADRAAHHHRPLEPELARELHDHRRVAFGREAVILVLPPRRRRGLAVPGHVEGDDSEPLGYLLIVQHGPVLPAIGSGRMQAKQWNPLPRLLEIDALLPDVRVAPDDRLELHALRGAASTSFTYWR